MLCPKAEHTATATFRLLQKLLCSPETAYYKGFPKTKMVYTVFTQSFITYQVKLQKMPFALSANVHKCSLLSLYWNVLNIPIMHLKLDDAKEEMEKLTQKQAEADEEMQKLGVKENEHSVIMLRKSS